MSLLVTGSIGIDTVETPHGRAENVLGGSSIYFSLAASLFAPVRLVGVVGDDFDAKLLAPLESRGIDVSGVERRAGSRTFRWHGRYTGAMNDAQTVDVKLNVLAERAAQIPPAQHIEGRQGKLSFKRSLEPLLSERTLYREKMGFAVPLETWFRGALKDKIRKVAQSELLGDTGILDMGFLTRLVDEHQSGRSNHSAALWAVLMFESSLKRAQIS